MYRALVGLDVKGTGKGSRIYKDCRCSISEKLRGKAEHQLVVDFTAFSPGNELSPRSSLAT